MQFKIKILGNVSNQKSQQNFRPFIQISLSLNELFLFLEYVRYIICLFRRDNYNSNLEKEKSSSFWKLPDM